MKKQTLKVTMLIVSMFLVFTLGATIGASSDGLQKVSAYLNYTVSLKLDGKNIELQDTPVNYAGKNYLPIAEMAKLLELDVNWNEEELTIELTEGKEREAAVGESSEGVLYYSNNDIGNASYINLMNGGEYIVFDVEYRGLDMFVIYDGLEYPMSANDRYATSKGEIYYKQEFIAQFLSEELLNLLPLYNKVENEFIEVTAGKLDKLESEINYWRSNESRN